MTSIIQTTASRKLDVRLKARSSRLSGKASCDHRRACPGDRQSQAAAAGWRMVQCFKSRVRASRTCIPPACGRSTPAANRATRFCWLRRPFSGFFCRI